MRTDCFWKVRKALRAGTAILSAAVVFSVPVIARAETGAGGDGGAAVGTGTENAAGIETGAGAETAAGEPTALVVEYESLAALLEAGNKSLKETRENKADSMAPYEDMLKTLRSEQKYMEEMAEGYEDDGDTEMQELYESNARQLKDAAAQINSRLRKMDSQSTQRSYKKQAELCLVAAQSLMNSYKQMEKQVEATEKQVEALKASYEEVKRRYEAGLLKEAEVSQAADRLSSAENSLDSLKLRANSLKSQLLDMLGIGDGTAVVIGEIPKPDMEAIAAVDFEGDKQSAITNDSTYVSERNSRVKGGSEAIELKNQRIDDAVSEELISFTSVYETLLNQKTKHEAASEGFAAAELTHQALLRKKEAGLLSNVELLEGEADYASAAAEMETADMELFQAYETYCWEVKGRV